MSKEDQATWIGWVKGLAGIALFIGSVISLWHTSEMKHEASRLDREAIHKKLTEQEAHTATAITQVYDNLLGKVERVDLRGSIPLQAMQLDVTGLKSDVAYIKKGHDELRVVQQKSIERITNQMDRIEEKLP